MHIIVDAWLTNKNTSSISAPKLAVTLCAIGAYPGVDLMRIGNNQPQIKKQKAQRKNWMPNFNSIAKAGVSFLAVTSGMQSAAAQSFNTFNGTFSSSRGGVPIGVNLPNGTARFEMQQVLLRTSNNTLLPPRNCSIPNDYYRVFGNFTSDDPCFASGPSFYLTDASTQKRADDAEAVRIALENGGEPPDLESIVNAYRIYHGPDGVATRTDRRQSGPLPSGLTCQFNQTTQALFPDACYSGNTLSPMILRAFSLGAIAADHATYYAGVVAGGIANVFDLSARSELQTCADDPQDCVSYLSYLGVKNAPGYPLRGLIETANATDPTVYRSLVDVEQGLACLRSRDSNDTLTDVPTHDLLIRQGDNGLLRLLALRLASLYEQWQRPRDKSTVAGIAGNIWASTAPFIHRTQGLLSQNLTQSLTRAANLIGNFTLGAPVVPPGPAETDALLVALNDVIPCA